MNTTPRLSVSSTSSKKTPKKNLKIDTSVVSEDSLQIVEEDTPDVVASTAQRRISTTIKIEDEKFHYDDQGEPITKKELNPSLMDKLKYAYYTIKYKIKHLTPVKKLILQIFLSILITAASIGLLTWMHIWTEKRKNQSTDPEYQQDWWLWIVWFLFISGIIIAFLNILQSIQNIRKKKKNQHT